MSASFCIAVGGGSSGALAERWNGARWTIQRTPALDNAGLAAVSCATRSFCVAVGLRAEASGVADAAPQLSTVAEWWNGRRWAIQSVRDPGGDGSLQGVWCGSANACIAVGTDQGVLPLTEAQRWNGKRWMVLETPNPVWGGEPSGSLSAVSCGSASDCTAVGSGADDDTLAESWNGQRWAVQPTPPTGVGPASLSSVSCVSVALCTAVGSLDNDGAYSDALAEGWNGTAWMVQSMPSPKPYASLAGVSCVPSLCVAVGSVQTDKGAASPLAEATP